MIRYIKGDHVINADLNNRGYNVLDRLGYKSEYEIAWQASKSERIEKLQTYLKKKKEGELNV